MNLGPCQAFGMGFPNGVSNSLLCLQRLEGDQVQDCNGLLPDCFGACVPLQLKKAMNMLLV